LYIENWANVEEKVKEIIKRETVSQQAEKEVPTPK
jgi:hypothetical protein